MDEGDACMHVPSFADADGGFSGGREHEEDEIDVTEDGELLGLLEDPRPALGVGHLPPAAVLQPLDLELHPPHPVRGDDESSCGERCRCRPSSIRSSSRTPPPSARPNPDGSRSS